jgi:GH15 family glucan-1,4-alpha-glucosidase
MMDILQRSVQIILAYQAESGAYPACPNFPAYRYSWFRDGAFVAYAMDLVGQQESAHRFHDWAVQTILRYAEETERAIQKAERGAPLGEDYLHTRYALDGKAGPADWPNFQLDGLGTWLWALAEHLRRLPIAEHATLPHHWWQAVDVAARYLAALWSHPCYDLWEEHPCYLHPYTLAAIYAGLRSAHTLAALDHRSLTAVDGRRLTEIAKELRPLVLNRAVVDGHLVKSVPLQPEMVTGRPLSAVVDASLLGVATPYQLLSPDDPIMTATVARIEADLHCPGAGVHRYRADTYYGGGEWLLLSAWLGWYYVQVGETGRAHRLLDWVEAQRDADGHLPEQVATHLLSPEYYARWEARWGPVAKPLLWSHAMYLILHQALETMHLG